MKKIIFSLMVLIQYGCCKNLDCDGCSPGYFNVGFSKDSLTGFTSQELNSMYQIVGASNDTIKITSEFIYIEGGNPYSTYRIKNFLNDSIDLQIDSIQIKKADSKSRGCCYCAETEYIDFNLNDQTHRVKENEFYRITKK